MEKPFQKNDQGKPDLTLIPVGALWEVAQVFGHGAQKYGRDNWLKGCDWSRYAAAALRHITQWATGEDKDESGYSHLAHAIASLLILRQVIIEGRGKDNRFVHKYAVDNHENPC